MSDAAYPYCITRASVQQDFQSGRGARFGLAGSYRTYGTYRTHRTAFTLIELLVVVAIIGILAAILFPVFTSAQQSGRRTKCAQQLRQLVQANVAYADDNSGHFAPAASDIFGANLHRWHGARATSDSDFEPSRGPLWQYLGRSGGVKKCSLLMMLKAKSQARAAYESGCGGFGYNYLYVGGTYYLNDPINAAKVTSTIGDLASASRTVMFTDAAMALTDKQKTVLVEESFAYPPRLVSTDSSGSQSFTDASPSVHFRHGARANVGWCDGHMSSRSMSFSMDGENAYGVDSKANNLGWFGPQDNSLWDDR